MADVFLKRGRDKAVRNRHPWIFSGAIARVEGQPKEGEMIDVTRSPIYGALLAAQPVLELLERSLVRDK